MKFSIFLFLIISLFSFSYESTKRQCEMKYTNCKAGCLGGFYGALCKSQCQTSYYNCLKYAEE
jgi:hypothetical protein